MSTRLSLPLDNRVEKLILWRDPKASGVVLAGFTVIYFLLEWSTYSLVTIAANLGLLFVTGAFLWANIAHFAGRPGPPVPSLLREGVTEGQMKAFAMEAGPLINNALAFAYRLATGKEVVLSLQVALALFVVSKLGRWFTLLGWAYTVVLLAFTLPKVYEVRKREIDSLVEDVQAWSHNMYVKYLDPYVQKIPRASNANANKAVNNAASTINGKLQETVEGVQANLEPKKAL